MNRKRIFLASSSELVADRKEFEIFIYRKTKEWTQRGIFLELVQWEDFLDAMSRTRLQDEYNKAIRECDIFVMLFFTKVGKYTEEEFETAFHQFQATNKPFIFTYFKDEQISTAKANRKDLMSLWAFQEKLDDLDHFYTTYEYIDQLKLHFLQQLDKLVSNGFIEFKPDKEIPAQLNVNGAIAQGKGATAVGAGGVNIGGNNTGEINTGTKISARDSMVVQGSVEVDGHFIGRDFIQVINKQVHTGEDPEEAKSVIAHYLYALSNDLAGLKLGEIDVSARELNRQPLQLADVYVPLDTHLRIPQEMNLQDWMSSERDRGQTELKREQETRSVSTLEALATHKKLTLLGKPGSGKSTFGAHVLLTLAQVWQGHPELLEQLGKGWADEPPLPIRVVLRRFAEQLPPGGKPVRAGDLWQYIERDLQASGYGLSAEVMKYVRRLVRSHGALMLLDGLDECGDGATRQRVLEAVDDLINTADPKCRFLLTARPYAWSSGPNPSQGVYALADLTDEQIEQFIQGWYQALETRKWLNHQESQQKTVDLLQARTRPDLLPLTRNPLLLTLTATLHANKGRLPEDRADLYNESVDLLMLRWNRQIGADKALLDELNIPSLKLSDLREVLEELAFKVHEESAKGGGTGLVSSDDGTADIGEARLLRALRPLLNDSWDKAEVVVDYIEKRAGLLIGQGEKDGERQFTFPHRTFQEFLAASFLAAQSDFPEQCARLARTAPGHWLVALPLAARLAKAERGASAAHELIHGKSISKFLDHQPAEEIDWIGALLAGLQLQEIGIGSVKQRERTREITEQVAGWLTVSLSVHPKQGGMKALLRAQAGDVLAVLGDPRFDPQCFHLPHDEMLGFVHIPADEKFRIGTWEANRQHITEIPDFYEASFEINDAVTPSPEFYIACYPVTVAQFRDFVESSQIELGDEKALRDPDNRPVRYVSWDEALAYYEWLQRMLRESPELDQSPVARLVREGQWQVTLPSELEWEKAVRGGLIDHAYPSGDESDSERANCADSDIGSTSAVGCFPANGYGLQDMSGNLWEWTRSLWGMDWEKPDFVYPYGERDQSREDLSAGNEMLRVVRGGSWYYPSHYARCAFRDGHPPGYRNGLLGFRVVLRAAPVSSDL